jgi:hypothetical protein
VAEGETGFLGRRDLDALVDSLERLLSDQGFANGDRRAAGGSCTRTRELHQAHESFHLSVLAGLHRAHCLQEHRRAG